MKEIYLIRHAKSEDFLEGMRDYERDITQKGLKDIETIGSYLALRGISPDVIFSSCAMRAQESTLELAKRLSFSGKKYFLEELYYAPYENIVNILLELDASVNTIFIIGHNPQLNYLANRLSSEHIFKIPTMGVISLKFAIDSWSELEEAKGDLEFFIYPKQFRYYMPKQIRAHLAR
jgi:phosphohistidine phosphatase